MKAIKFTGEIGQKVSNSNLATIEMGLSFKNSISIGSVGQHFTV